MNGVRQNINGGQFLLILGGAISAGIALLHLVVIFVGAPAYRYFGAGEEMAAMDEQGSWIPAAVTLAIVSLFTLFAFLAFSGASLIRRLPFLRTGLAVISGIFILRGLGVIGDLIMVSHNPAYPIRAMVFSLGSLAAGLVHLAGTWKCWVSLRPDGWSK